LRFKLSNDPRSVIMNWQIHVALMLLPILCVERMGSAKFKDRERAFVTLDHMLNETEDYAALLAVKQARTHADAEIASRASFLYSRHADKFYREAKKPGAPC
jgi:hypothetical protein